MVRLRKHELLLSVVAILAVASGAIQVRFHQYQPQIVELSKMSLPEASRHWEDRIKSVGGERAYAEFADTANKLTKDRQHDAGHIFGEALFSVMGVPGVTVCDGRFSYACFHAYSIAGIREQGWHIAKDLYAACKSVLNTTADECLHGIGHGIMGALGKLHERYTFEQLKEALGTCDSIASQVDNTKGCNGGVFMEFNLHSMNSGFADPRPFDETHALEPCTSLPTSYQESCAYWMPMWWLTADPVRYDVPEIARAMGQRCLAMSSDKNVVQNCISGIANRMDILTGQNPAETSHICSIATTEIVNQYICQYKSAERFTFYHPLEDALKACDGLSLDLTQRCRTQATEETVARRRDIAKYQAFDMEF